MTKANECTCPSGDGTLRHPCPAHPASVEQAGGDERAAFELFVRKHCGMPEHIAVNWDAKFTNDAWEGWKARAALAQPSPAPADEKPGDSILCSGCFAKGVGPEHFDEAGKCLVRQQTEPLGAEFAQVLSDNLPELLSTAQAEQAEAERPEVVAVMESNGAGGKRLAQRFPIVNVFVGDELMTVAQYERIVGELRAVIAQLRQHKNDYMDSGQETYRALQNEIREREAEIARLDGLVSGRTAERDAALAKVAELTATRNRYGVDAHYFNKNLQRILRDFESFTPDELARSLIILAKVADEKVVAQAQHSVPEEFIGRLSEFLAQRGATGKALLRELREMLMHLVSKAAGE
ncbi:hypothetical protein [Pseudomonas aeruginosa]|uniref:hypothetical protein n=1 Tax=Pseudomonas aeruginosa TaxID=287 RepID=UPI001968FE4A|nr:hypothetical protein [Pseudomonas aeruginosa]